MEKNQEYFIPINEVSKQIGVPAHTLRYWEKQFSTAIRPVTGAGNRRYYRRETVEKIQTIKTLLYDKGMTIMGVKKILHNGTFGDEVSSVTAVSRKTMEAQNPKPSLNSDDIDMVIDLLTRAKMFLD